VTTRASEPVGVSTQPMAERVVRFGRNGTLVGILTEPAAADPAASGCRGAVVMSNIGFHHRVGPYRLYVELARRLVAAGWHVLRFDLSGLGDSEAAGDGSEALAGAAADDVDAGLAWLSASLGVERFVLVGVCSGVDSTHAAALRDPRVVGAVFIDGYTYPTPGYRLRHYTLRFLSAERWKRYFRRRRDGGYSRRGATVFDRTYPPLAQFQHEVATMIGHGARLLFVFTGTIAGAYNARTQLFEMLGPGVPREQVDVEWAASADHLFSSVTQRAALLDRIARWSVPLLERR
jgi:dienelactone hydrolase